MRDRYTTMEFNTNMTVTNGNVNADEIASMQSQISELTAKLTAVNSENQRLRENNNNMRESLDLMGADWRQLNAFLNEYADKESMCGAYEDKLRIWNNDFRRLQLEGRIREFQVECEVSFRYTTTITVEAANEDDARSQVEDMSAGEVMQDGPWDCPDHEEFEIASIELA